MKHLFSSQYSRNQAYHQQDHSRRDPLFIKPSSNRDRLNTPSDVSSQVVAIPYELYLTRNSPHEGNNREDRAINTSYPNDTCPSPTPQSISTIRSIEKNVYFTDDAPQTKTEEPLLSEKSSSGGSKLSETMDNLKARGAAEINSNYTVNDSNVHHTIHFNREMQRAVWRNWRAR